MNHVALSSGDTASFSSLSTLLESSPLGDDQIQQLVDLLLTRKDDGWQSASKGDDSASNWKKKFTEMKEQCEDGMCTNHFIQCRENSLKKKAKLSCLLTHPTIYSKTFIRSIVLSFG